MVCESMKMDHSHCILKKPHMLMLNIKQVVAIAKSIVMCKYKVAIQTALSFGSYILSSMAIGKILQE